MKYIVALVKELPSSSNYNAWSKAPADIVKTLESVGIKKILIVQPESFYSLFVTFFYILKTFFKVKTKDELFIQNYSYALNILIKLLKLKDVRLHYIIHDVYLFRFGDCMFAKKEIEFFKKMDVLYVHTETMKEKLSLLCGNKVYKIMHLFDYYSNDQMCSEETVLQSKKTIAFAGNLDKSQFLYALNGSEINSDIEYKLYGLKSSLEISNPQIKYMGIFKPNETGLLCAGWGLLWDGTSIDTCNGKMGEYLRINSSHKLSLYLASGMPVIVWTESSLAQWLNEKGVCITVNSLSEISSVINSISNDQYKRLVLNARDLGNQLREGRMLKSLL